MVTGVMLTRRCVLINACGAYGLACRRHDRCCRNHEREGDIDQPGVHRRQYM